MSREERKKVYKEGYEQGRFDERMEQSLTPPTEEEVCEAYRDFYHIHLDYNDLLNQFEERKGGRAKGKIIARPRGECVEFLHAIHPHLITLIGRFYEGRK
jgi:hypothetical protein